MAQDGKQSREWYTARELAAMGLTGMPSTERAIQLRAKREGWTCRKRQGRGGGVEYAITSLPREAQDALLDRTIAALPEPVCQLPAVSQATLPALAEPAELPSAALLKGWQRRCMDARCAILQTVEQLAAGGLDRAIKQLCKQAAAGTLPGHLQALIPSANARGGKNGSRTLSARSIYRWRADLAAAGNPVALAPIDPKEDPRLPAERRAERVPAWAPYFLKCYRKPQKPSVPDALAELAPMLPAGIPMPSKDQAYRFLDQMSAVDRERGRKTGNELRALKGYRPRDTSDMVPCEVYQCDGHSFKARVAHPVHGKPFHPEVCAVIDAATRVVTGWSAGLSESNQTVADALRHGCTVEDGKPGGIPAIFYTDPGSGNFATVNADPVFGRYARLGITFKSGIVGNSQARGMIERLQQTLWIKAAKQLPTYTGNGMDGTTLYKTTRLVDAQVKKTGGSELLPSWPQFLDLCRQAVERYNHSPHRSLPKTIDESGRRRHMTPMEAWQSHLERGWVPPTMNQFELDDCFRPRVQVTTRRGNVRLFGNVYYHKELEHHGGEQVFVEYEVQDGSRVWVRDRQERLICIAGFESNKARMFPKTATEVAMDQREVRRLAVVERRAEEIREERRGVIDTTPAPAVIEAARKALEIEMAQPAAEEAGEHKTPDSELQRYRMARSYERMLAAGEVLPRGGEPWLQKYRGQSEYKVHRQVEQDLGGGR